MPLSKILFAIFLSAAGGLARADLYGYVDAAGVAHFAAEKIDSRYQLFARGEHFEALPAADAAPAPRPDSAGLRAYAPLLEQAAVEFALDLALLKAITAAESGFNPGAVSAKGAIGLMQVMPATAERYGVVGDKRKSLAQKLHDPATNIRVGARYLADLSRLFPRQTKLVIASYNAGEGAVQRYNNKIPPFPETRDYVDLVSALYLAYRSPVVKPSALRLRSRASNEGRRLLLTIDPGAAARTGEPAALRE